jgi:acetyl-CoA C-acetyltransferase/acetyl-CoA acyltransferase
VNPRDPESTLALIAGYRTPFCKAGTDLRGAHASDLAAHVFREVLDRTGLDPADIDEVILGCGGPDSREANVARVAALRAGLPHSVPAVTVQRNCASGMEALLAAEMRLRAGDGDIFLVGGAESMSSFPLMMGPAMVKLFERLQRSKSSLARVRALLGFRPSHLKPRVAIIEGLTDPVTGMMMGSTTELLARRFAIDREAQDQFAMLSHNKAERARSSGRLDREIAPIAPPPRFDTMVMQDNGIREGQSLQALSRLRPVFDRREGDVTVGNSCQLTDGAVGLLVMSQSKAADLGLRPLALIRGHARVGLDPRAMGLGPVHATPRALEQAGITFSDLDLFEINEAFAAQVLACLQAFASEAYCQDQLGCTGAIGEIPPDRLNVNGGAIALGHPIAASGARLALTLAEELRSRDLQFGLATLCVGGGQGQAMVLEAA